MRIDFKISRRRAGRLIAIVCLLSAPSFAQDAGSPDQLLKPVEQVVPYVVKPLPPSAVKLTGGPLKQAQDLDAKYLLDLEPDRMLAHLRTRAGLEPKARHYGGWDGDGRQLTGHIAGHYLSAVSYMYAATGDERFKERADYVVAQLKEIQDKQGDGYIGGLMGNDPAARRDSPSTSPTTGPTTRRRQRPEPPPVIDGKILFRQLADGNIRSGGFDLNGMWAPWYVQHKIFAGLRDAYRLTGNKTALDVEIKLAEWCHSVVGGLSEEQAQKMLATEFGGMNEALVDLYADTGDKRWLTLADQFNHHAIVRPLARAENILPGKHGNTQVPKLFGNLVRYVYTGDKADGDAARNMWDFVVDHHTFASGGHGYDEYFGPADKLSGQVDGTGQRSKSLRTAETCNVYNMLKMTRVLNALKPDVRYADFQERALYNHILASIDPKDGRTSYMVPVGPGVRQEYTDLFEHFTCCIGTGMESHALHADGLYFEGPDRLSVAVYAPSTVDWKAGGARFTMATDFPAGDVATFTVDSIASPRLFTLSFRKPSWAGEAFKVTVGSDTPSDFDDANGYVSVTREWKAGDVVTITMPKSLRTEPLPDNADRVAILWGPLVLAGDFGAGNDNEAGGRELRVKFPVFPYADRPLTEWLKPVDGKPGTFSATLADGNAITLSPFYALHNRRYGLYWDLFTPTQWAERQAAYAARDAQQQALANATVAYFQPGEMQPERDFSFQGDEASSPVRDDGQPGRRGGTWWSLESPIDPAQANAVLLTVRLPGDAKPEFTLNFNDVAVGGAPATQLDPSTGLTEVVFRLPVEITQGKSRGVLKLQAADGKSLPAIYGVRTVRAANVPGLPR